MNQPLVSVIIPCYNNAVSIKKTIQSVLDQQYSNLEILIVNDGSTDDLLDVLNERYLLERGIRLINNENHGVAYSRNYGIRLSRGDFILFLDADDILDDDFIFKILESIESDKMLYGTTVNKVYDTRSELEVLGNEYSIFPFVKGLISGEIAGFSFRYLFPRANLDLCRFPEDTSYMEDYLFLLRYIMVNDIKKIVFLNDTHYNYIQNENSVSNKVDSVQINKNIDSFMKALDGSETREAIRRFGILDSVLSNRKAKLLEYSVSKISDYQTWKAVIHNNVNRKYIFDLLYQDGLSIFWKFIFYYLLYSNYFGYKIYQLARRVIKIIIKRK